MPFSVTSAGATQPAYTEPIIPASADEQHGAFDTAVKRIDHAEKSQAYADESDNSRKNDAALRAWQIASITIKQDLRMQAPEQVSAEVAKLKGAAKGDARATQCIDEAVKQIDKEHQILPQLASGSGYDMNNQSDRQRFGADLKRWNPDQWNRFDYAIEKIDGSQPVPETDAKDDKAGAVKVEAVDEDYQFRLLYRDAAPEFYSLRPVADNVIHEYTVSDWDDAKHSSNPDDELRIIDMALSDPSQVNTLHPGPTELNQKLDELQGKIDYYKDPDFWDSLLSLAEKPSETVRLVHDAQQPVSLHGVRDFLAAEGIAVPYKENHQGMQPK